MKYRIVKYGPNGFAVQERILLFGWFYLHNAWGIPPAYETAEAAEQALLKYLCPQLVVVKEIES